MNPVARQPTLSPTKLTTYLACPTKYKWTYVDPRGKWYIRAKSYYSFGTTLHHVLQRFHDAQDQGVTTVEQAVAEVEESWVEAGYNTHAEMLQAQAEGKSLVARYVENVLSEPITAETKFIEKMMRLNMGEFALIGRMDRVDEHPDGSLEIIDYKSGRASVVPDEVANDIAMGCYQLILHGHFPDQPIWATIIAIRSGARASHALSEAEREELREQLIQLGTEILHRDWENHEPHPKQLCYRCDFLPLCQKNPGFREELTGIPNPAEAEEATP